MRKEVQNAIIVETSERPNSNAKHSRTSHVRTSSATRRLLPAYWKQISLKHVLYIFELCTINNGSKNVTNIVFCTHFRRIWKLSPTFCSVFQQNGIRTRENIHYSKALLRVLLKREIICWNFTIKNKRNISKNWKFSIVHHCSCLTLPLAILI